MHGYLPEPIPSCDVLILAGDLCPPPYFPVDLCSWFHQKWLDTVFRYWLERRLNDGVNHIVAIAGNHDVLFDYKPEAIPVLPWHYLQDHSIEIEGVLFYGTPWTAIPLPNWAYEWAFPATEEQQVEKYKVILDDTQVLISHAPPYGTLDQNIGNGVHFGSQALASRRAQLGKLALHVFGHAHAQPNEWVTRAGVTSMNVALMDERERPNRPIFTHWL